MGSALEVALSDKRSQNVGSRYKLFLPGASGSPILNSDTKQVIGSPYLSLQRHQILWND
jgi:V8-like Glu-specific endopeptidase